ncbi:MAG TPA: LysR substrate-binding domain-containing protein [Polyangiales bacterium]|nr:LysR substrate-binding domain-containing protein [Polyangiales bacterium]
MDAPNLQALIALEAVARLGSVTRAAAELHLTQSAVSHRLHSLSRELGVQLVERDGRGVALTTDARDLAQAASTALTQLNAAIARVSAASRDPVLAIGCSPSFAIRFLVPRSATFRKQHPELDLRIAASDVPIESVHATDVAIHLSSGPTSKLFCEKLIDEVTFPVVSPRLRGDAKRPWTESDLRKLPLLHDEALSDDPKRVGWNTWLEHAGFIKPGASWPSPRGLRFSHAYLAIEAALAGDGVALVRRSLVADDLARGRLIAPFPFAVPSGLAYWFVSARDPKQRPSVLLLREFLSQQLRAAERVTQKFLSAAPKRKSR